MGGDRTPQARQRQQLARKQARRGSDDRILIVSEGSKTEPNYLHEIRQIYRLHTANLAVYPSELGTAPIQVVEYAKTLFEQGDARKSIPPRAFEQVYAVFDRDDHNSYVNALNLAESLDGKLKNDCKQGVRFQAIASVPSFELWLLLHYEDIQAPIHRKEVMARLKKHLPHYAKGLPRPFSLTQAQLPVAMQRAEALATKFSARTEPQPFTAMAMLVKVLTDLKAAS